MIIFPSLPRRVCGHVVQDCSRAGIWGESRNLATLSSLTKALVSGSSHLRRAYYRGATGGVDCRGAGLGNSMDVEVVIAASATLADSSSNCSMLSHFVSAKFNLLYGMRWPQQ